MIASKYKRVRKIRVLHVIHSLDGGGAERIVCDMARRWKDELVMGCACLDSAGSLADKARSLGVDVFVAGRRKGLDPLLAARLVKIFRKFRPDIIHAHQYTPYMYSALAASIAGYGKVIFTEHGRHYPDTVSFKRRAFNNLLRFRRDRLTAVCKFAARALESVEGLGPEVTVIPNGVRCSDFKRPANENRRPAEVFGFDPNDPVCIQVARLHPVKDHATSLRAFGEVVKNHPRARLVVIGDGQCRTELETLRNNLKLEDNVILAGQRDDVPELLKGSDLFVLSSLSEGASLSILEAMSASLAVVATDVGGNGELVIHGRSGLLTPRGDSRAMAASISALLGDRDRRERMARYGSRLAAVKFDQKIMHERFMNIYTEMAGGGR